MAFNKNKALESALKFLNQGKVTQAIGEYQQILRHDAKDQATLMTVGDLFARQGDMPQAIEYFERLAQVYLSDGFNSKAIAIYKKIAKLAPAELAPLERLADLYVQQGVLSEARPLFLQIAEAHLKANRAPKAVEVLHRLLEVEPENPRVQMRLAELYNVMGQKKEAAQTYLNYAQRLFERDDPGEAAKLIERALEVDSSNPTALLLKAKILSTSSKPEHAIPILERHPETNDGGDVTNLLLDIELKAGHTQKAAERARKQLARGHEHTGHLQKVAERLIEGGKAEEALPILQELREPMIEAGEQDKFLKLLTGATEREPGKIDLLELLVDFCRHTSDSFRLPDAINKLADAFAATGNYARAEELIQELIDKNKDDERLVARLEQLRARSGGAAPSAEEMQAADASALDQGEPERKFTEESASASPAESEESFDEETQRYIAQALTDVDLFSSYGLTQKATHLLENVLQRAPRHTPTLERLLDLYLGAGNERRTAEMASQLEQIHRERGDTVNAERFTELRQRFQKAAGLTAEDLPPAAPAPVAPSANIVAPSEPQGSAVIAQANVAPVESAPKHEEFAVSAAPAAPAEFEIAVAPVEPEVTEIEPEPAPVAAASQPSASTEEVDLSDEWEAMVQDVEESAEITIEEPAQVAEAGTQAEHDPVRVQMPDVEEPQVIELELAPEPTSEPALELDAELDPAIQPVSHAEPETEPEPELALTEEASTEALEPQVEEPTFEIVEEEPAPKPVAAETVASADGEFELELTPQTVTSSGRHSPATTDDFLSELAAEVDDLEVPGVEPVVALGSSSNGNQMPPPAIIPVATPVSAPSAEVLNELAEVFQEFRNELGELSEEEDEDLETHYNLGIAYREMGLLDEAIGEFQKVAKAVQKGKPFAYAMNCSTLLALTFIDKGEPKIASLWYKRALEVPQLEQETILALRYDLGVALEMAGESTAALDSFRQVYAMNIDYRDVADHIATLQKR